MKIILLLLLLLLINVASPNCRGFHSEDLIQGGTIELSNKFKQQLSCVSIPINYNIPFYGFQYALSTSNIDFYQTGRNLDYSVRGSQEKNSNSLAISFRVYDNSWKKITISYIVTSRKDLHIGSFIIDIFSLFSCSQSREENGILTQPIHQIPFQLKKSEIAIFLSGVRANQQKIDLSIWDAQILQNSLLQFKLQISQQNTIQNIHVSYIIWNKQTLTVFAFNPIDVTLADYQFIGAIKYIEKDSQFLGLAINTENGNQQCKNQLCQPGFYHQDNLCRPCSSSCLNCNSQNTCLACKNGFYLKSITIRGQKVSFCEQVCGDKRVFVSQCDDGNTQDYDGCSSNCEIEQGWNCKEHKIQGSICKKKPSSKSNIKVLNAVHLPGKIVQGISLSYLPPSLLKNNCQNCDKLLWARITVSDFVPAVRVQYIPDGQCGHYFIAEFDFFGLFLIKNFTYALQINPDYEKYFKKSEIAEIKIEEIDPSLLSRDFMDDKFETDNYYRNPNKIHVSHKVSEQLFEDAC